VVPQRDEQRVAVLEEAADLLDGDARAEFDALFRIERYLANLDGVFERLEKLPVEEA